MYMRSEGFTVIEALAALLVIGAIGVSALGFVAQEMRSDERSDATLVAAALTEDLLFRAQFIGSDSLTANGSPSDGQFAAPLEKYHWHVEITQSLGDSMLLDVFARVSWRGGQYSAGTRFISPHPLPDRHEANGE